MNKFITFKSKLGETYHKKSINIANIVSVSRHQGELLQGGNYTKVSSVLIRTSNGDSNILADNKTVEWVLRLFEENKLDALCSAPIECIKIC